MDSFTNDPRNVSLKMRISCMISYDDVPGIASAFEELEPYERNDKGFPGESFLVTACQHDAPNSFRWLLEHDFPIDKKDIYGRSLAKIACCNCSMGVLKILEEKEALDPVKEIENLLWLLNTHDRSASPQIHLPDDTPEWRSVNEICTVLDFLLVKCPSERKHAVGWDIIKSLLGNSLNNGFLQELIESGHYDVPVSAISQAVFCQFPEELVQCLLKAGCEIDETSSNFLCPAIFYVCAGIRYGWDDDSYSLLEFLLENGADVNFKCKKETYPTYGTFKRFPLMIRQQGSEFTALHVAAVSKSESKSDLVHLLCKSGADVNAQTELGNTPLMLAVQNLQEVENGEPSRADVEIDIATIQILLQSGADPDVMNNENESCVAIALRIEGYDEVKLMLLDTFVSHGHFKDVVFEELSVPLCLTTDELQETCCSPRNLKTLARNVILKATNGRHCKDEETFNFLPENLSEFLMMDYYYLNSDWFIDPHTL